MVYSDKWCFIAIRHELSGCVLYDSANPFVSCRYVKAFLQAKQIFNDATCINYMTYIHLSIIIGLVLAIPRYDNYSREYVQLSYM